MKNITTFTLVLTLFTLNIEAQINENFATKELLDKTMTTKDIKPFYQGKVLNIRQGGSYIYIEIQEQTHKSFWIATNSADAKIGDFIRFQKEIVVKNFKSKALDKVFKELMFASNLQYLIKD